MPKRSFDDEQVSEQLMLVARNLRLLRAARGLSQRRLAEAIGSNQAYLSAVEKGAVVPGLGMLVALGLALNATLQELVSPKLEAQLQRQAAKQTRPKTGPPPPTG